VKKALVSFTLIFVLTLPFWLIPSYLYLQKEHARYSVKEKLKQQLSKEDLKTLRFSKHQVNTVLDWEHEKEFEFNGNMYDVIEKTSTQDSVIFIVWKDNDETTIKRQLDDVMASLYSQPDPVQQVRLICFIKSLIYQQPDFHNELFLGSYREKLSGFYCFIYSDPELSISSPPPQLS
jgi:hypothetical protein